MIFKHLNFKENIFKILNILYYFQDVTIDSTNTNTFVYNKEKNLIVRND